MCKDFGRARWDAGDDKPRYTARQSYTTLEPRLDLAISSAVSVMFSQLRRLLVYLRGWIEMDWYQNTATYEHVSRDASILNHCQFSIRQDLEYQYQNVHVKLCLTPFACYRIIHIPYWRHESPLLNYFQYYDSDLKHDMSIWEYWNYTALLMICDNVNIQYVAVRTVVRTFSTVRCAVRHIGRDDNHVKRDNFRIDQSKWQSAVYAYYWISCLKMKNLAQAGSTFWRWNLEMLKVSIE